MILLQKLVSSILLRWLSVRVLFSPLPKLSPISKHALQLIPIPSVEPGTLPLPGLLLVLALVLQSSRHLLPSKYKHLIQDKNKVKVISPVEKTLLAQVSHLPAWSWKRVEEVWEDTPHIRDRPIYRFADIFGQYRYWYRYIGIGIGYRLYQYRPKIGYKS